MQSDAGLSACEINGLHFFLISQILMLTSIFFFVCVGGGGLGGVIQYANTTWENDWLSHREVLLLSSLFDFSSISSADRLPPQGLCE